MEELQYEIKSLQELIEVKDERIKELEEVLKDLAYTIRQTI